MKNLLLGIIAINLTFISANLAFRSVEPVQAQANNIQKIAICDAVIRGRCMHIGNVDGRNALNTWDLAANPLR